MSQLPELPELPDPRADVRAYNGAAWDRAVGQGNRWTQPVGSDEVARARAGELRLVLTPQKPVPRDWFPRQLRGARVLCLASGGGQQGPLLAAAGAQVTVLDFSQRQLLQDRLVAAREGLQLHTIRGDMADLSMLPDDYFELIFHPVSNCFAAQVRPVWRECARVLRPGGSLLAGFTNPVLFSFDPDEVEAGRLVWRWPIPYSDLHSLSEAELRRYTNPGEPLVFGHTLEDQLGGQVDAGLCLTGFYEDRGDSVKEKLLHEHVAGYIATRAYKPKRS